MVMMVVVMMVSPMVAVAMVSSSVAAMAATVPRHYCGWWDSSAGEWLNWLAWRGADCWVAEHRCCNDGQKAEKSLHMKHRWSGVGCGVHFSRSFNAADNSGLESMSAMVN